MFDCAQRPAARANNSLQQQPTFQQPSESQAAASVLLFRHLPGAPERQTPLSVAAFPLPHLPPGSGRHRKQPGEGKRQAGRTAPDCDRRVRCSIGSRVASLRRREDCYRGGGRRRPKPGKSSCTLRRRTHLWEAAKGRQRRCARLELAVVSSTFAIRCLPRSCSVSGRREGLTPARTRTAIQLSPGLSAE